jgi:hypothetical protein
MVLFGSKGGNAWSSDLEWQNRKAFGPEGSHEDACKHEKGCTFHFVTEEETELKKLGAIMFELTDGLLLFAPSCFIGSRQTPIDEMREGTARNVVLKSCQNHRRLKD